MKYKSHVVKRNIITVYISKNNKIHKNEFIQLLQILSIYLNSLCEWFLFSHSSPCCCNSNCLAMLWSIAVIVHTYTHSSVPPSLFGYNSCNFFSVHIVYVLFSWNRRKLQRHTLYSQRSSLRALFHRGDFQTITK